MKKKFTSDLPPSALSTVSGKWIVFFVLNDVEFSTTEIDTEDEARAIMRRVRDRVTEWSDGGTVWVEESDDSVEKTNC